MPVQHSLSIFNSFKEATDFAKRNPGITIVRNTSGYGRKAVGHRKNTSQPNQTATNRGYFASRMAYASYDDYDDSLEEMNLVLHDLLSDADDYFQSNDDGWFYRDD
ncbi:hypothetical protein [Desulfonema magnum]|nr:hypothetical protein [Desulfonema magnum]